MFQFRGSLHISSANSYPTLLQVHDIMLSYNAKRYNVKLDIILLFDLPLITPITQRPFD